MTRILSVERVAAIVTFVTWTAFAGEGIAGLYGASILGESAPLLFLGLLTSIFLTGSRAGEIFRWWAKDLDEREIALRDRCYRLTYLITHAMFMLYFGSIAVLPWRNALVDASAADIGSAGIRLLFWALHIPAVLFVWLQPVPPHPRQDLDDPTPV